MGSVADRPHLIRGEHIFLRPAERDDLPLFVEWLNDAEVARHLTVRAPLSQAAEEGWFDSMQHRQGKTDYHFVICLIAAGKPIGTAGLHEIHWEDGNAEFGIAIGDKEEWNQGYGTDALRAICDFGFDELRLQRIELLVYAGNQRARRSYEKAGFTLEGTLRRAHYAHGEHKDVHVMSLLRDEWAALPHRRSWEWD